MTANIKQLRAFVAVAETSSFAEASERVHLSQPAVSLSIRKLEEGVGGPLFSRSTRQVALTPEGREFLPVAQRLLRDWNEAFEDLNERYLKKRGKVSVAALPTLAAGFLPHIIAAYRSRHPQIKLSVHDVLAEHIVELVREGRVDFGLSVPAVETDEIAFEPILDDHYVAILPTGHPLLAQSVLPWRALVGHPFIGISPFSSARRDIDEVMNEAGIQLDMLCEVNQLATVGRMVAADLGISVLPALSLRQIARDGIEHRPLIEPEIRRPLGIVSAKRRPLSAAGEAFTEITRQMAKL